MVPQLISRLSRKRARVKGCASRFPLPFSSLTSYVKVSLNNFFTLQNVFLEIWKIPEKTITSFQWQFYKKIPWQRYRIESHSASIRNIPIHSDIFIRANANRSEPIRKTVETQSDLMRLIPRHQFEWIRTNPKPSFQFRSIRSRIAPNQIHNQNQSESLRPWFIRINSDWKFDVDQSELGMIWSYKCNCR